MHHKFELSTIIQTILAFPRIPSYSYKLLTGPRDAFRLILLQPAPHLTSPISCRMIESSWGSESGQGNQKGYTALSYTWGNPVPKAKIEIDGRPFHITQNLERALRHLRAPRNVVKLWADSICINQDDVEERNFHVSQMRSIYAASRSTTVFLGEATAGSDALLQAIESSSPSILTATTKAAVVNSLVSNSGMRKHELIEQAFKILWRPYWVRIWIFQEIVVSPNPWIQCGNMKVPWDTFCQAIIALLAPEPKAIFGSGYGNEARQRLEDMYWERRAYRLSQGISEPLPRWDMSGGREFEGRMGLLDLLVGKRGLEASDGRDMVFAISGIARKPKKWEDLSITYEKSPARVYMDTVKYLLDHNKTYEVLSHAGQSQDPSRQHLSKIPSWAPDWRVRSEYKHKIVDENCIFFDPHHKEKTRSKPQYAYLPSHSILACLGTTYSAIQSISPDTSSIKPSPGSIGRTMNWAPHNLRHLIKHGLLSPLGTKLSTVTNLISRSHPLVYKRRLARTSTEVWALVPFDAEVGDLIVVFRGGGVFVLRRKGKEEWKKGVGWREWMFGARREDVVEEIRMAIGAAGRGKVIEHCRFVGECFVDGLMHKFSHVDEAQGTNEVIFAMH